MEYLNSFRQLVQSCTDQKIFSAEPVQNAQSYESYETVCTICLAQLAEFIQPVVSNDKSDVSPNDGKQQHQNEQVLNLISPFLQLAHSRLEQFMKEQSTKLKLPTISTPATLSEIITFHEAAFCIKLVGELVISEQVINLSFIFLNSHIYILHSNSSIYFFQAGFLKILR